MGDKKVTLKLEKVSKSFAKIETDEVTHALNEIDLTLNSGEFISLVGPSGCGKSTILRLVAGLIVPTKGTVSVDGKEVKEPSPERGMVFQKPTLFPWLTVEKNIAFSLRMQGKLKGNEDKVKRMIDVIGLEAFKDDYPDQLSGGMATRVLVMDANPGRIVDDIKIDQTYPRDRSSQAFVEYRNRILNQLHFGGNS